MTVCSCFIALAILVGSARAGGAPPASDTGGGASASPQPRIRPAIYDERADAAAQIAAALERAKADNRRVLIQWGNNRCSWCTRLHDLLSSNKEIARTLRYEYEAVPVDTGGPQGKNFELARSYGADVDTKGYPFLTVLDAVGKPVANQETESLEVKGADGESSGIAAGHDPAKVLAFLRAHQPPPLVATEVLEAGVRDAKASGRKVLVHFGAPWCPWCVRLDEWLRAPDIAPVIGKGLVDVSIDVDRMTGGKELLARHRQSGEQGGIPWFAIVDVDGMILATSTMSSGANTGFPAAEEEIAHFGAMLERAAPGLASGDRAALLESLRALERGRKARADGQEPPPDAAAAPLSEEQKIERLIAHIEGLRGATFIRNGGEHSATDAAAHLRRKLGAQRSSIRTAEDFIRLCGTKSSVSGDVYVIRLAGGREVECAAYLREQVDTMTKDPSAR